MSVPGVDRECKCGKRGCINSVAATDAIVGQCLASGAQVEDIDEVVSAAIRGDKSCREVLRDAARAVGYGIANCINIFAPNDVIVTGRLVAAQNIFLDPLHKAITEFATTDNLRHCSFAFDDSQNHIEAIGASLAALLQHDFLLSLVSENGAKLMLEAHG